MQSQQELNERNARFWDELCGTSFAHALGITGTEPDALERYDAAYLDYYPYLAGYVDRFDLRDEPVLEIGLGYGTLGGYLVAAGADYHGLDISDGPVQMMRHRLHLAGVSDGDDRVVRGSALEIPHPDGTFSYVYTIGCLHHTGDVAGSVREVARVLKPGGKAVVMLYNRHSFRQLVRVDLQRLTPGGRRRSAQAVRALYDTNQAGDAAPHTDYLSVRGARRVFSGFRSVHVDRHNFDDVIRHGEIIVARRRILGTPLERLLGLDLYIVAEE